jgi:hypothetical protein
MNLTEFQKRTLMFLLGCMVTRSVLVYVAKTRTDLLPILGVFASIVAVGFTIIYIFGLRKTGAEVFNKPIWWNNLRPVHAILYGSFGYLALNKNEDAWKVLAADTFIGFLAWMNNSFK